MAVELAVGYISLVPSAKGSESKIIKEVGDLGDDAGKAFERNFSKQTSDGLKDSGKESAKGFTSSFSALGLGAVGGIAGGFATALAGPIISAGIDAAKGFVGNFFEVLDRDKAADRLGASLGLDDSVSAELGKLSGQIYADNFGDSIADVNESLRGIAINKLLPALAPPEAITALSKRLLNITSLFGADIGDVTRDISTLMRTSLAGSAEEALDVITRGFQTGADRSDDFLDTLQEYPTQFRKLGLTAEAATGLISQGLQNGARDSDIVADALKEFSIRAVDGSTLTSQSFKRLGIDGAKMAKTIAKGGPEAAAGLDKVLDKLRETKDPVERAQIAVGLFGTQAEDLGDALFALDPSSAVSALGQVAGAADQAGEQINDNFSSRLDSVKRLLDPANLIQTFQTGGFDAVRAQLGVAVQDIADIWNLYGPQVVQALNEGKDAFMAWFNADDGGKALLNDISMWFDTTAKPVIGDALGNALQGGWDIAWQKLRDHAIEMIKDPSTWASIFDNMPLSIPTGENIFTGIGKSFGQALINGFIDLWNAVEIPIPEMSIHAFGQDIKIFGGDTTLGLPDLSHVSFHSGGIVPGRPGSEMFALLQAGETVVPTQHRPLASVPNIAGGPSFGDINVVNPHPYAAANEVVLAIRKASVLRRIA